MADDVKHATEKNAQGPVRAKGDPTPPRLRATGVGEVQQHRLKDQVAADRYLASKESGDKPTKSLRFTRSNGTSR
ncbi:MAG: hypothetical protein R6V05_09245 [Candidatus Brocadiia bacterium]